ncbi:MAG: thiamine-phosphate kinase [Acidobacteriota bacterium]
MILKEIGEIKIIEWIKNNFQLSSKNVLVGIGDDTSVLRLGKNNFLITKDLLIEDVHFKKEFHPPFILGKKSISVNVSDVASMGGTPLYALLGGGFPKELEWDWLEDFLNGIKSSLDKYKIELIGGDICLSEKIFISITLIGRCKKYSMRKGAKTGDKIFVSGELGNSSMGLELLISGKRLGEDKIADKLIKSHLDPEPRLKLGKYLVKNNLVNSMIDLSDGLSKDIHNLCRESACGADIYLNSIPVSKELEYFSKYLNKDKYFYSIHGGEDYELLFTSSKNKSDKIKKISKKIKIIGIIKEKEKGINLIKDGKKIPLKPEGWEHF